MDQAELRARLEDAVLAVPGPRVPNARTLIVAAKQRRHSTRAMLACVVAVCVCVGLAWVTLARRTTTTSVANIVVKTPPPTHVSAAPIPKGWKAYDYGLARIAIPGDWTTSSVSQCLEVKSLHVTVPGYTTNASCLLEAGPVISVDPYRPTGLEVTRFATGGVPYETIFPKCLGCGAAIVRVPSLHVAFTFYNINHEPFLKTLGLSTYGHLLRDQFPATRAGWRYFDHLGFRLPVPAKWKIINVDGTMAGCGYGPNIASYTYGTYSGAPGCPFAFPTMYSEPSTIRIDDPKLGGPMADVVRRWDRGSLHFAMTGATRSLIRQSVMVRVTDRVHRRSIDLSIALGVDDVDLLEILASIQAVQ